MEAGIFRVRVQKSPLSVEVEDVKKLADEFIKTATTPDKAKILEHIKETGEVPIGATPVQKKHIRIY